MSDDWVTRLLPVLVRPSEKEFNVFDVMRHGTHEKQLSNVFAWLLDAGGTHELGDGFQRIFIHEVNRRLAGSRPVPVGAYSVRQEVNTSGPGEDMDIADLVLEDHETTLVVENYYTSSGHGHSYRRYLGFGAQDGKRSVVVMLCETEDRAGLVDGWEHAPVLVYSALLTALGQLVDSVAGYRDAHPEQCAFFDHLQRRFVRGLRVNDENLIDFIEVLCATGMAERFGHQNQTDAAINLGDSLREEAIGRFTESRELLMRTRNRLRDFSRATLVGQVNDALGEECLGEVSARYRGLYEWTVNIGGSDRGDPLHVQLKFGPSAWYANEADNDWRDTVPAADADYSRLFVTDERRRMIRQSTVSLKDSLDGLAPDDIRLRDDIVALIRSSETGPSRP